jgi:putative endonuclease
MANKKNGTLYTGVTSDLVKRVWQHKNDATGFTGRYKCKMLVWYEVHATMISAIEREKRLKGGSRAAKGILISTNNPDWNDLYASLI